MTAPSSEGAKRNMYKFTSLYIIKNCTDLVASLAEGGGFAYAKTEGVIDILNLFKISS